VDDTEAASWLDRCGATTLIHGHTHRPADHDLGGALRRIVLSDWDLRAKPPRAEVLRIGADARALRLGVHRLAAA
jgi:UDP-2,3-diacylglucosamine hydrolase